MPTLNEFIEQIIQENNMNEDPKAIAKYVEEEAERIHEETGEECVGISDEDVRNIIINYPTLAAEKKAKLEEEAIKKEQEKKDAEERKAKAEEEKKLKEQQKQEKAKAKEIEKANAGEQQSLF